MWIKTTENTLVNSSHVARFSISGTVLYAELPSDLEQGEPSGPNIASCKTEEEAGEMMRAIFGAISMNRPILDMPECLKHYRHSRENARRSPR